MASHMSVIFYSCVEREEEVSWISSCVFFGPRATSMFWAVFSRWFFQLLNNSSYTFNLCFRSSRSLKTSSMTIILIFQVFPMIWHGLPSDDRGDSSGFFRKKNREFRVTLSFSMTSVCSVRLLWISSAPGQTNREVESARLANACIDGDDWVQCSIVQSNILCSAAFWATYTRVCSRMWKDAVSMLILAVSKSI